MIPSVIIVVQHFPPRTVTKAAVPCLIKAVGGTAVAMNLT